MSWQIQLPYRSRSDSLVDVAEAARELPSGDDRAIARQIALGALVDGLGTAKIDAHRQVESASRARWLKVRERERAGRETQFALDPLSGALIDVLEQEDEAARAAADEARRRARREARDAEQADALQRDRERNRAIAERRANELSASLMGR